MKEILERGDFIVTGTIYHKNLIKKYVVTILDTKIVV